MPRVQIQLKFIVENSQLTNQLKQAKSEIVGSGAFLQLARPKSITISSLYGPETGLEASFTSPQ